MTGRGRPKIGRRVQVRLPDDLHQSLQQWATIEECALPELIRRVLGDWLATQDETRGFER